VDPDQSDQKLVEDTGPEKIIPDPGSFGSEMNLKKDFFEKMINWTISQQKCSI
jgi:hypothetical protein